MKDFSELGIVTKKAFIGDSIPIEDVKDVPITVEHFEIKDSTKKPGTKCLHLQITKDGVPHVIFTSAKVLMSILQQINENDFPFKATIVKVNWHYEFK